jgi:hypothetical protein
MKTILSAVLGSLFVSTIGSDAIDRLGQQPRWVDIEKTAEYVLSIDQSSVRGVPGGMREVWFRRVYAKPRADSTADGKVKEFIREAWLYRFDCSGRTLSHRERILYARTGAAIRTMDFTDPMFAEGHLADMKRVAPETGGELLFASGCALTIPR